MSSAPIRIRTKDGRVFGLTQMRASFVSLGWGGDRLVDEQRADYGLAILDALEAMLSVPEYPFEADGLAVYEVASNDMRRKIREASGVIEEEAEADV